MTQGRSPSDEEWDDLVRRFFESSEPSADMPEGETPSGTDDYRRSDSKFRDDASIPEAPKTGTSTPESHPQDLSEFFTEENSIIGVPHELNESSPELEDHFIPPEPRPIATGNPLTVLAWIGAAGGPLLLVVFAIAWRTAPFLAWFGAIVVGIAGMSYLWWGLPQERDEFNNGAQL